jgi:hypothetical protein
MVSPSRYSIMPTCHRCPGIGLLYLVNISFVNASSEILSGQGSSSLPWPTSQFVYMPYDARGSLLLGSACFVSTSLTRGAGSIQELRHFFAGSRYLTELTLQREGLELYGSSHLAFSQSFLILTRCKIQHLI